MAAIPETLPREEQFGRIIARLHARWRLVVGIPLFYIVAGVALRNLLFVPEFGGEGFLPPGDVIIALLVGVGVLGVGFGWMLLGRMLLRQPLLLVGLRGDANAFLERALELQLSTFLVCDLVASPGIVLFLLTGDLVYLVGFVLASSVFYLRALPSERRLGAAFLREKGPDTP